MIERARLWWHFRSRREQRLIVAMLALLAAMILWLAVVRPLSTGLHQGQERYERAVIALARTRADANAIRLVRRHPVPARAGPIAALVGRSAREAGFTLSKLTPVGADRVDLAIDAARAPALFAWIANLERRQRLIVDRLAARANSDATIAVEFDLRTRNQ